MKSEEKNHDQQPSVENSFGIQFAATEIRFWNSIPSGAGIWVVRLPVASAWEAVNVYLLQDGSN